MGVSLPSPGACSLSTPVEMVWPWMRSRLSVGEELSVDLGLHEEMRCV